MVKKSPKSKSKVQSPKSTVVKPTGNRQIKTSHYKSFRLSKKVKMTHKPLTGSFRLLARSLRLLWRNGRQFGGVILIYVLLTIVLVRGFGITNNLGELNSTLRGLFAGQSAQLATSFALFTVLLGSAGSVPSEVAGVYQSLLLIVMSLVFIWMLRYIMADKRQTLSVRDGFYKGLYPLVPFLLVLLVIGLQLIPLAVGNFLLSTVIGSGLAVTAIEKGLWLVLIFLLALLSLYMLTSSVFALYIVTLPDVRPLTALRSARELVRHRRSAIMRKIIFLPLALLVMAATLIIPILMISPTVAEWVFFLLSMCGLAITHTFLYNVYRELL